MENDDENNINGSDSFPEDNKQEKFTGDTLDKRPRNKNKNLTARKTASDKIFTKPTADFQSGTDNNNEVVVTQTLLFECDICNDSESVDRVDYEVPATSYCKECMELFCDICTDVHKKHNLTTTHTMIENVNFAARQVCESCKKPLHIASHFCIECDKVQCTDCRSLHIRHKLTRKHTVLEASIKTTSFCKICEESGKRVFAPKYCKSCHILLCIHCVTKHTHNRPTSDHEIVNASKSVTVNQDLEIIQQKVANITVACPESHSLKIKATSENKQRDKRQPGKPIIVGDVLVESICLIWEPVATHFDNHSYQVGMKEYTSNAEWIIYPEQPKECTITLTNFKSGAVYIFKVRMVNNYNVGPFSEISEPVETPQSAAHRIIENAMDVKKPNAEMPLKGIPFQEDQKARNVSGKTRKLIVGQNSTKKTREKTIMLVGATGTGKSTLVDGMINYILGVTWKDPYRLTLVDLEEDEAKHSENQAVSQTKWITCYTINHQRGARLGYTLNIVDTPGFGDTRGIARDKEIVSQIKSLFSTADKTGVMFIDAICFLTKAPDARLTPTQLYIFEAILSIFGRDIKDNICMMITFADGRTPPVLSSLKEAKLEYNHYFQFNNGGLFADNSEHGSDLSKMFWDMGYQSLKIFFDNLLQMETQSIQLTREVLNQRELIEITLGNLLLKLDAGLSKVEQIRKEIGVLKDNEAQIKENQNFTYTVTEIEQRMIDLPKGQNVTNCLQCHTTCHKKCMIANDEDKKKCKSMDKYGNCTQCPGLCVWNMHRNTAYIFEYVPVEKQKTYTEMLEKYRKATDEVMTRQKVIERMNEEALDLEEDIIDLMDKMNNCTNILKKIALRPDPLSIVDYIDLLITTERNERRPGFQDRINSLMNCRKTATITEEVGRFTTILSHTSHDVAKANMTPIPKRKRFRSSFFDNVSYSFLETITYNSGF